MRIDFINKTANSVDTNPIAKSISTTFEENNASKNACVSVALVEHKEIVDLAVKYLDETLEEAKDHPVLSFVESELEEKFIVPSSEDKYFGEIVVSYQKAFEISKKSKQSIEKAIADLASHGALHLLGIHHN